MAIENESRWQRIVELFTIVANLPDASQVQSLLDSLSGDDAELRPQLQAMLAAHFNQDLTLGIASGIGASDDERDLLVGRTIGQYTIQRRIACGGMGTVYEAQQDKPRRRVALKVIRSGFTTRATLQRFELESQVLARLQHPAITQVYEVGTFDLGEGTQPYFIMEYVDGVAITKYAQENTLSNRARLDLVTQVCEALEHAHQRGIIHRDLKPGNILVCGDADHPTVKVVDFGIARVTESDFAFGTLLASQEVFVGTLPYMSPEQIGGDSQAIDVVSDVYSLGVICYELLTRQLPFDPSVSGSVFGMMRQIRESTPPPLGSTAPMLRGDLETIVTKAMEKDPARRYGSAAALAADIRAFLCDQPIAARPPSQVYLMRKFAKRNKALVAGTVASFMLLLAGLAGTSWQAVEARRAEERAITRFDDLHQLTQTMLYDVHDAIADLPGATEGRRVLLERAVEYLNRLYADATHDENLLRNLAEAYERVADVYSGPFRPSLGHFEQMAFVSCRAVDLRERLVERNPGDINLQLELVRSYRKLGIHNPRQPDDHPLTDEIRRMRTWPAKCQVLIDQLASKHDTIQVQIEQVRCSIRLNTLKAFHGDQAAFDALAHAIDSCTLLLEQGRAPEELHIDRIEAGTRLGAGLANNQFMQEARGVLETTMQRSDAWLAQYPGHAVVEGYRFSAAASLAIAMAATDSDDALQRIDDLIAQSQRESAEQPNVQSLFRRTEVAFVRKGEICTIIAARMKDAHASEHVSYLQLAIDSYERALSHLHERERRGWVGWWEHDYREKYDSRLSRLLSKVAKIEAASL